MLEGGLLELIKRALYETGFVTVKAQAALKAEAVWVYFINSNERQQSRALLSGETNKCALA